MVNTYFCPNPECENHKENLPDTTWYTPNGLYKTHAFGAVQRYKCKTCNRGFSTQTFSLDYFAKKVINYEEVQQQVSSSVNNRALARNLNVSPATVTNRIDRLSRQCISFHTDQLAKIKLAEDLAADGFESFCVSQYFPDNINLLVGDKSQFVYFFNYVLIRRKGRMTDKQKEKRAELEKLVNFKQKGHEKGFREILVTIKDLMNDSKKEAITISTDEKPDYKRAIEHFPWFKGKIAAGEIIHNTISSRAARTHENPLFPVNYMDRELRKDQANHRRETVCFARNVNNMLNRMMIYFHWHNYHKPYRIADKEMSRYQHAEQAGLDRKEYTGELFHLFTRRRFLSFSRQVKRFWKLLWKKMLVTPLSEGREYYPRYALA